MADIKKMFDELMQINAQYGQSNDSIITFKAGMDKELVCVPVIGKFSSGKSAALNTLLGYGKWQILKQDIKPETAVPTEIHYRHVPKSADKVYIYYKDGTVPEIRDNFDKFFESERDNLDYSKITHIRLSLEHEFLATIPRIKLVDMPGFDSGDDKHETAIDNYIENSMAYIITFPAESGGMTVTESLGDRIKELCAMGKPVCIMITKMDKVPSQEVFDDLWCRLKKDIRKYVGDREIERIITSEPQNRITDLKKYLSKLQDQSELMLQEQKFFPFFGREATRTLLYLNTLVKNASFSESELKETEQKLNVDMEKLMKTADEEARRFKMDTEQCAQDIVADVRNALNNELDSYIAMAMSQRDEQQISERINNTVRLAANNSVQQRFVAKAQKYFDNISAQVAATDSFIMGIPSGEYKSGDEATGALVGGARGLLAGGVISTLVPTFAGGLMPIVIGTVFIPVIGIVLAAVSGIVGLLAGIFDGNKKREEARAKLRQQFVSLVFPGVLNQLSVTVRATLSEKTSEICTAIEQQIKERKSAIEKALADCHKKQADDNEKAEQTEDKIQESINILEGMLDAIK